MIFTHKTSSNFTQIENRIEEDAKKIGLMLKKHYPFSINLPEMGFKVKENSSVFEFCNGKLAANLLNTYPEFNILMPCRISIYEKSGECFVSTPDLNVQLEMIGCKDELKEEILALYENMKTMIKGF